MQFGRKGSSKYSVTIDGVVLPVVTSTKFLGICIDAKLTWQTHFDKSVLKIIRNIHLLKVSKNQLNIHTKKLIYYAPVYSNLVYGCTIWGNMLRQEQIKKLQKLQNKCIAQITEKTASTKVYQSLKIMKITEMIKLQNLS